MSNEKIIHPNVLPNYQKAMVKQEKIEGYTLNPNHDVGKHKARVFKSALGFTQTDWQVFTQKILDELPYNEAVLGEKDKYGQRYNVTMPITGINGNTANVITAWIIETDKDYPSYVTAMVE